MTRFLIYKTGAARVRGTSSRLLWKYIASYFLLSGKDLFTQHRKRKKKKKTLRGFVERSREKKTTPQTPSYISKKTTRINIHIQTNAVLWCTDLREFYQHVWSRDIQIHQSHLQTFQTNETLDITKQSLQEGCDTAVKTTASQLLVTADDLLPHSERGSIGCILWTL